MSVSCENLLSSAIIFVVPTTNVIASLVPNVTSLVCAIILSNTYSSRWVTIDIHE
ncbi:MAG: hypothetical protein ACTHKJ_02440 [Candidatus Nitrosocosmicus sp.]